MDSDNWVVQNLENALGTWNTKMAEVWQLLTMSPQSFKGGGIWSVIVQISRYAIVKAAAKEVGNVGGRKFWKWFGFNEHVHWCACFTSYIAEECGYIKSGLCPKSAVVSGWISFYKKQGRWAGRNYTPHSGDFIIFDWEGDGEADHIGIVESCDGKTVRTIEGNSGDVCRRQAYSKGSSVIVGYGCPAYKDP